MKRIFLIAAALLAINTGILAQDIRTENLPDFNKVSLSGKLNVVFEKADDNLIEIKLTDSDITKFKWDIKDGMLTVRLKPSSQRNASGEIKIYYKDVAYVKAITSAVRFEGELARSLFTADISSGATLSMNVNTSDFTLNIDGNSAAAIKGKTSYFNVKASKRAKVDAKEFESKSAAVTSRYGAEVFVWATEKLDASAGTGSAIYYKSNPEILKMAEKMMGTVEQYSL